jgi:hypothetical protein
VSGLAALALGPALLAAAPAPAPPPAPASGSDLVLDCYVMQSGDLSIGQFVRHIEVHANSGVVSVADSVRGGPLRFLGNGQLISLDATRLVFDVASSASSGRTEIDRGSGAYVYNDGRVVIRGTCQPSAL